MKRQRSESDRENTSELTAQTGRRREKTGSDTRRTVPSLHREVGNQRLQSAVSPGRERPAGEPERSRSGKWTKWSATSTQIRSTLMIGDPDDRHEREAERVAKRVSRMRDPMATADTGRAPSNRVQRMCSRCQRRFQEGKPLNCETCEEELQRKESVGTSPAVDAETQQQIQSLRGGGRPLPKSVRSFFEPRFGREFSDVRVHIGHKANKINRRLGAEALTLGSDVVFARGNYRPQTDAGRQLLAHELTHVVQQTGGGHRIQRQSTDTAPTAAEKQKSEKTNVELDTWADLWQRGGGLTTVGGGMRVGTVYFSTDESALDSEDRAALGRLRQQLARELGKRDRNYTLRFIGWADKRGSAQYNLTLSDKRARNVAALFESLSNFRNFGTETTAGGEFTAEQTGEGAEELAAYRRVDIVLEPPISRPIQKPDSEPEPDKQPEKPECQPAKKGFPPSPSNCAAYEQNSWWLPSEYVHNATCACLELPDSPTANCVRKHLQDRMAAVPKSTKEYWAKIVAITELQEGMTPPVPGAEIDQETAEALILERLVRIIYEHHVDAYKKCCCKSGPAPYPSWIAVANVPLPCEGVEQSIRLFGSCGRGGW